MMVPMIKKYLSETMLSGTLRKAITPTEIKPRMRVKNPFMRTSAPFNAVTFFANGQEVDRHENRRESKHQFEGFNVEVGFVVSRQFGDFIVYCAAFRSADGVECHKDCGSAHHENDGHEHIGQMPILLLFISMGVG